ncbi:MAG: methionyl-tRNA formyltransferase [Simkaniaceae bacterium]
MRIIFFGTPPIAADILRFLIENRCNIVGIVSRPDRPKGRSLKTTPTAVKICAKQLAPEVPIFQPEKASSSEMADQLKALKPDLFIVVAYGEIIKQNLLDVPKLMPVNIHMSLLPKYRGAAPIERVLMNGENETGVTIIEMVLKMDAGDILHVEKVKIEEDMTKEKLTSLLTARARSAIKIVIEQGSKGKIQKISQDASQVTFAPKILPEEGLISFNQSAQNIHNKVRALSPKPGAYTFIEVDGCKKRLKVLTTKVLQDQTGEPGQILSLKKQFIVACQSGSLQILSLQPEGKKAMPAKDFLSGIYKKIIFVS